MDKLKRQRKETPSKIQREEDMMTEKEINRKLELLKKRKKKEKISRGDVL